MLAKIKILIVEDHLITRIGLKMVLNEESNLEVVGEAEDGKDCLNKVKQLNPDVILLDIGLPLIDGIECANRLKSSRSESRIIMRSSHEEISVIFSALATGAEGYCSKNNPDSILINAIRIVASGFPWLDPLIAGKIITHYDKLQKLNTELNTNSEDLILKADDLELLRSIANNNGSRTAVGLKELMKKLGSLKTTL